MARFEKLFALLHGRPYCAHKWVVLGGGRYVNSEGVATGVYYHVQCEKCGEKLRM
jgi:hypothetical protein